MMKAWMLAASLMAALPAGAQFRNAADAVEYRQGALAVLGHHFSRIGAMVDRKLPFDAKALQADADVVAYMSHLPWPAFVEGSDKGDTAAKPEIWSQPDKFKADAQQMQAAVAKLADVAPTGNADAIKTAFGSAAETCKSCHDDFRRRH